MGGGGKREIIYLSLHCHHQNNSCIKMGSDASHFNVSLNVRDKVTRQCPQTTTFEEKGEPKCGNSVVFDIVPHPTPLPLWDFGFRPVPLRKQLGVKGVNQTKRYFRHFVSRFGLAVRC